MHIQPTNCDSTAIRTPPAVTNRLSKTLMVGELVYNPNDTYIQLYGAP